jgi:hypothetical protein
MLPILFLGAKAAPKCKNQVGASSQKNVILTDAKILESTNPGQIEGHETMKTIESCQFRSCKHNSDNVAIGFYGLGLVTARSKFINCKTSGRSPAVGATRFSLLSPPPW